mgnify:CR=1 FL=1|jgi:hypothetical protein
MGMRKTDMTPEQQISYLEGRLRSAKYQLESCKDRLGNEWTEDDQDSLDWIISYLDVGYAALMPFKEVA